MKKNTSMAVAATTTVKNDEYVRNMQVKRGNVMIAVLRNTHIISGAAHFLMSLVHRLTKADALNTSER